MPASSVDSFDFIESCRLERWALNRGRSALMSVSSLRESITVSQITLIELRLIGATFAGVYFENETTVGSTSFAGEFSIEAV